MKKIKPKHIIYTLLFIFGSIIIIVAGFILFLLFATPTISTKNLTSDFEDFLVLYYQEDTYRDLPQDLNIVSSICTLEDGLYEYTITLENTDSFENEIAFQLYASEDYHQNYGTEPLFSVFKEDGEVIASENSNTYRTKGVILGTEEEFVQMFEYVYLEVFYELETARILVPVEFID